MRTWGYSGQVGEWFGAVAIPRRERQAPIAAAEWLLSDVSALLSALHRPREMQISWAEFDATGQELAFHESETFETSDWQAAALRLKEIAAGARGTFALSSLFVTMDTAIVENGSELWAHNSAELQFSIPPPYYAPTEASVSYCTSIDIWLSSTRNETGEWRSNVAYSRDNLPRLMTFLASFRALVGESFDVGESFFYHDRINNEGFSDG
jgi:hypothetical protein